MTESWRASGPTHRTFFPFTFKSAKKATKLLMAPLSNSWGHQNEPIKEENAVLASIKNYILENPNAFQIASTFVIGVIAFAIWSYASKNRPPK